MLELLRPEDCCGCTACANICGHGAITMEVDQKGFQYPKINESLCTDCGLCDRVCPIIGRKCMNLNQKNYKMIYAGRIKDDKALLESASGGAFWALASCVISDGGIVFGATYDYDMRVVHRGTDTLEGCRAFQGSKYSQSDTFQAFREIRSIVRSGRKVLFTGTPCQVDGLLRFLIKKYDNLLTMDVVCHAVPSPKIFADYISYVNNRHKSRLSNLTMRDKTRHGWGHPYSYRYDFSDGKSLVDSCKVIDWGRIYFSRLVNRPCCHECKYTNLNRPSDISVADFWDDRNLRPDLYSNKGTSLLIVNTSVGASVLKLLSDKLQLLPVTEKEAMQPSLDCPTIDDHRSVIFWNDYAIYGFNYILKKYFDDTPYQKCKNILKKILSYFGIWHPK